DHRLVADGHVGADHRRESAQLRVRPVMADVDHGAVLHVGARADAHIVDVAADHHLRPHGHIVAQLHVADHAGVRVDVDPRAERGKDVAVGADAVHAAIVEPAPGSDPEAGLGPPSGPRPCAMAIPAGGSKARPYAVRARIVESMDSLDTPVSELRPTLDRLRAAWQRNRPDARQRLDDLARLREAFTAGRDAMLDAIAADFGHRSVHETLLSDAMTVTAEIDHLRSRLRGWMKPRRVGSGWRLWPARAQVRHEPVGVVGVMSPWNYPLNLALIPLATAIAAGNHAYLKPSEHTPRTSQWLRDLLAAVFPADRVAVALGDAALGAAFSALPF